MHAGNVGRIREKRFDAKAVEKLFKMLGGGGLGDTQTYLLMFSAFGLPDLP
jgi:hypothetical protein